MTASRRAGALGRIHLLVGMLLMLPALIVAGSLSAEADGICVQGPYLYVSPPPGAASNSTPQGTSKSVDVSTGQQTFQLQTGEVVPQAQILVGDGALAIPPATRSLTVSIEPVPAPAAPVPDGHLDSNVYRYSITTAAGAPVGVAPGKTVNVILLAATPAGGVAIERSAAGRWARLGSSPLGGCADQVGTLADSLGDFAAVAPGAAPGGGNTSSPAGGGSGFPGLAVVGAVLVLLVLLGVAVRLVRDRRSAPR